MGSIMDESKKSWILMQNCFKPRINWRLFGKVLQDKVYRCPLLPVKKCMALFGNTCTTWAASCLYVLSHRAQSVHTIDSQETMEQGLFAALSGGCGVYTLCSEL
uniref:Uncharacterized protein n=1 Tax=Rhipicephalus zambeziensis TaxID=60191 RepID=A0A224YCK8_9ACAR